MSTGTRLPREHAAPVADTLAALLTPHSRRVMIAGSLRRGRPDVADVEIVALCTFAQRPAPGQGSLFGEAQVVRANVTLEAIDQLVEDARETDDPQWAPPGRDGCHLWLRRGPKWGERYRRLQVDFYERQSPSLGWPVGVDLFLVHESAQWGWISVLRTGSSDFNQWLLGKLRTVGVTSDDGWLWRDGQKLSTPEEADVFALAGTPVLAPNQRDPSRPQEVRHGRAA